ncbi:MAG: hypothetical protein MN733_32060 [Nitrososphaera sp.]|nr:hypothetical protein [Nitrososphaera sp.]
MSTPLFQQLPENSRVLFIRIRNLGEIEEGARIWLDAWNDILYFCDRADLRSIPEFDECLAGTQSLFNWIGDLEIGLWNAGIKDRQFLRARIAVCEETLRGFALADSADATDSRRQRM